MLFLVLKKPYFVKDPFIWLIFKIGIDHFTITALVSDCAKMKESEKIYIKTFHCIQLMLLFYIVKVKAKLKMIHLAYLVYNLHLVTKTQRWYYP